MKLSQESTIDANLNLGEYWMNELRERLQMIYQIGPDNGSELVVVEPPRDGQGRNLTATVR